MHGRICIEMRGQEGKAVSDLEPKTIMKEKNCRVS